MKLSPRTLFPSLLVAGLLIFGSAATSLHAQEVPEDPTLPDDPTIYQTTVAPAGNADLSGSYSGFKITRLADGKLKIAVTLTLVNNGTANAKNVRGDFYLSTDSEVDPEDLVHTIKLADYNNGKGKLKHGRQIEIPFKQKVVSFVGSKLDGQYLLVRLTADNNVADSARNLLVIGPISVPK